MHVYLPPGYDADTQKRYPVLYLDHRRGRERQPLDGQRLHPLHPRHLVAAGQAKRHGR
jgi:hypothetical protein